MAVVRNGGLLSLTMEVRIFSESKGTDLVTGLKESAAPLEKHTGEGKR